MGDRHHTSVQPNGDNRLHQGGRPRVPDLPFPPTTLVGQERPVAELAELLARPSVRLVTLTGAGGIGKTRLALALARSFAGEAAMVPLAPVADPALIPLAILQAIGVTPTGSQPMDRALDDALRDRDLLLVLDSVEHLLPGTPVVIDLLGAYPRLTALATSRTRIGLSGEHVVAVEPLETPNPTSLPPLEHLAAMSSVRLFVSRAQAIDPAFRLNERNAEAIATICQQLGGLPLAIELAAARCRVLSPQELARRLERRLEVLTGGPIDAPQRHRTMREAISWSHELLSPEEQRMFRRLAVFEGGASLGAISAVAGSLNGADAGDAVVDLVSALVDHNLVTPVETADDEEPRIDIAGAIRELALERLSASDEESAVRDAHAAHFVDLALEGESHMVREVVPAWLDLLERDHANFRAALAWTLRDDADLDRFARGGRIAGALWLFWYYRGHLVEARAWLKRALARSGLPDLIHGKLLLGLGMILHFSGEPERAREVLIDGLDLLRAGGDLSGAAYALTGLGNIAEDIGHYDGAAEAFAEANALFTQLGDDVNVAITHYHLGVVAVGEGDLSRAVALFEDALARSGQTGDPWSTAASLSYLGLVRAWSGDVDGATGALREALALYRHLGSPERTVDAIQRVAVLATAQHSWAAATRLFAACDTLGAELGLIKALPEREIYAQAQDKALQALPPARGERERDSGAKLSLQAALAEAEDLLDPADHPSVSGRGEHSEQFGLSPREREVLRLMADGASNDEIAEALHLSRRTAAQHVGSILAKLDASNRTAATTIALRKGLV